MKAALVLLAVLALAGCALSGQKHTEQGVIQMPGERPAPNVALSVPPDEWAAPPRR